LHFAGLHGYPRKYLDYPDTYSLWNILSSYGSILSTFALFLFIYLLLESFLSYRLVLSDSFTNSSPESSYSNYVFGHSYLSEVYFVSTYK
jgi:heme/copper-type cytochrome/quinol oxidase subunit 1